MGWENFHSIWDDPVDGDDNTAESAKKKKKLSWWDEFEKDRADSSSAAERYSYRDAFDDSDARWYRKGSFNYSKYSDYSPSRLFRSTFSGFSSGIGFGTFSANSAENELKNKAIRALRVLTRNANTVADKSAKISYTVKFSDGIDTNQPVAEGVSGKSGKQQEQVIFISPDAIAEAKTADDDDAAIDALTGFVLLRVQIAQSVPKIVLDALNATSMMTLPKKIAGMAANKELRTAEAAKEAAAMYTDEYSAGLIAKNLLTRIARRGVVQDWGGFAPYFVRHAKKFAAIREKLLEDGEGVSVELLSARIAYNMLADDNQIPLPKEIEAIVEKHLSAELAHAAVLPACHALVEDLRAHLTTATEQPPAGDIESAMNELFNELASENEAAEDEDNVEEGMRETLEDVADLLDHMYETYEQNTGSNRFGATGADINNEHAAANELYNMDKMLDELSAVLEQLVNQKEQMGDTASDATALANEVQYQQSMLDSNLPRFTHKCGNMLTKHEIPSLKEIRARDNPIDKSSEAAIKESCEKYIDKLEELRKKLEAAVKAEISELREKLKSTMRELGSQTETTEKQLQKLTEEASKILERAGKFTTSHAHGSIVATTAQRLQDHLKQQVDALKRENAKLADAEKLSRVRSPNGLRKAASTLAEAVAAATNALTRAIAGAAHNSPHQMRQFMNYAGNSYSRNRANGRSLHKMPKSWHAGAIDEVLNSEKEEEGDFESGVISAAHKEMLDRLIEKLTNSGNVSLPNSTRGEEVSAENKEAIERAAAAMGMSANELLRLLREMQNAKVNSSLNVAAEKLGKEIEEKIIKLAEENSPVDEELFGKEVSNTTALIGEAVTGVNDEARNRAEEEFVAFLSHNNARPIIKVKRPAARRPDIVTRTLRIKKQHRKTIESVRNALQFQGDKRVGEVHGLLSGDLDEGSLHKLRYDSEHIWSQKTIAKLPDVAVGILVDQSGSMSCGNKISQAREMCIVLAEAVKQIEGVHLHVYGHTANQGGTSDLTLFEHYSSCGDARAADLSGLGAIEAYSNNYDGYAIKEAAKRLSQDPAKRKYLFIIADGFPAGSGYGGEEAEKHVTSVCTYTRTKLNIATYAFAVGNNSTYEQKRFEAQYGKSNVVFISTVTQALPKIVRFLRNALQKEKTLVDTSAD